MKTLVKILPIVIFLASCSSNGDDAIKKEIISKRQEIVKLEQEIIDLQGTLVDTMPKVEKGTLVKVVEVKPTEFKHYVEVQGKLDGEDNVQVYPKGMGGSVNKIYVKLGQTLTKGQVIATIDDEVLQKSKSQIQSQYDLALQMYDKQKALWDQKIGSEIQYLQAKAQKEALESSLASIEKQIADSRITSPIDGRVEDLPLRIGQTVSPGFPVATVINFSSIKVVAEIAEAYSMKVRPGDSVIVSFPDLDKETYATITNVSNYINPKNRSFTIEVKLTSKNPLYKANMLAVLKINDYKAINAVTIPVNYIQTDAIGDYVYLVQNNEGVSIAKKAYIEQGESYKGLIEVLSGIDAGDKLITSGYLSVTNNAVINY